MSKPTVLSWPPTVATSTLEPPRTVRPFRGGRDVFFELPDISEIGGVTSWSWGETHRNSHSQLWFMFREPRIFSSKIHHFQRLRNPHMAGPPRCARALRDGARPRCPAEDQAPVGGNHFHMAPCGGFLKQGYPQSSIFMGFSMIFHKPSSFGVPMGTPIIGNLHVWNCYFMLLWFTPKMAQMQVKIPYMEHLGDSDWCVECFLKAMGRIGPSMIFAQTMGIIGNMSLTWVCPAVRYTPKQLFENVYTVQFGTWCGYITINVGVVMRLS